MRGVSDGDPWTSCLENIIFTVCVCVFSPSFTVHLRIFSFDLQYSQIHILSKPSRVCKVLKTLNAFVNFVSHAPNTQSQSVSWWNTPMMKCLFRCMQHWVKTVWGACSGVSMCAEIRGLASECGACWITQQADGPSRPLPNRCGCSRTQLCEWEHFFHSHTSTATRMLLSSHVLKSHDRDEWRDVVKMALCSQTLHRAWV